MKTFNASELNTSKRTEIFNAAREEGAIVQRKNTNGEVIEEFVMIGNNSEAIWELYQADESRPFTRKKTGA